MFSPMSTFYYWEENREEIYRSAPTRVRICKRSRLRRGRRQAAEQNENAPECLSHGPGWKDRFEQLIDSLVGKVLADRQGLKLELASVVCSCDERNREKCRDAARRFGFTIGSNLPRNELTERMRFTELYFHNILNSPQFTEEHIDSVDDTEPYNDVVRGLFENKLHIFALVQRCVLHNDLKAYRLLDVIRQYIQKPCQCVIQIPLPNQREEALEWLVDIEKNDHINIVKMTYGCSIMVDTSRSGDQFTLDLHTSTANIEDLHEIQSYFVSPIGIKIKTTEEVSQSEATGDESAAKSDNQAEVGKDNDENNAACSKNASESVTKNQSGEEEKEINQTGVDSDNIKETEPQPGTSDHLTDKVSSENHIGNNDEGSDVRETTSQESLTDAMTLNTQPGELPGGSPAENIEDTSYRINTGDVPQNNDSQVQNGGNSSSESLINVPEPTDSLQNALNQQLS